MNDNKTIVSVIIPTYNRAHKLSRSIKSVLNQTFSDFELIIIDDGSTDNTKEIVNKFQEGDNRIKYIKLDQNKGEVFSRNKGVEIAKGDYIAFLDSDDRWLPQKLEKQLNIFKNSKFSNLGFVGSNKLILKELEGNKIVDKFNLYKKRFSKNKKFFNVEDFLSLKTPISPTSVLILKEALKKVGPFDEKCFLHADYDMWIRLSEEYDFETTWEILSEYYLWEGQISIQKGYLERGIIMKNYLLKKHKKLYDNYPRAKSIVLKKITIEQVKSGKIKKAIFPFLEFFKLRLFNFIKNIKKTINNNSFLFIIINNFLEYSIYWLNIISNYSIEKRKFYKKLGYKPNIKDPKSFNEKVVFQKINNNNPLLSITADKYSVRSYLKNVLGENNAKEILIPLLHSTNNPKTIPFETLPPNFIIKANHGSGWNIIIRNGNFNKKEVIKNCKKYIRTPYGLKLIEKHYNKIKRKIVIEELIEEEKNIPITDYKFLMVKGRCLSIQLNEKDSRGKIKKASFFNENFKKYNFFAENFEPVTNINPPNNLNEMILLAQKLSEPFEFVRIDLFLINKKIYFNEFTHYPVSGMMIFDPTRYDFELGKKWDELLTYKN